MPREGRPRDLASTDVTGDAAKALWRAATQRRETAAYLLKSESNDKYLDAVYLAGCAAECALKTVLNRLRPCTREDILLLLIMAPSELRGRDRQLLVDLEFENPLPSLL